MYYIDVEIAAQRSYPQMLHEHTAHLLDRCGDAGEAFKLQYCLVEEHFYAGNDPAPVCFGLAQQFRFQRGVDDIKDGLFGTK